MAEVTFETTVQKTVIEVEDMTGTTVNVEPTPEVSFSVENGNAGGGGSSDALEQFFGVQTIEGYEFMSEEEVYQMLEEIMTTMDNDLTAEGAASITAETQTIIH